jgi:hypothetical protein
MNVIFPALLIILLVAASLGCFSLWFQFRQVAQSARILSSELESKRAEAASLQTEVATLRPYSAILDAQAEANRITQEAQQNASTLSSQYQKYVRDITQWSDQTTQAATAQAKQIVEEANQQEEKALQNKTLYEETAEAMRNVIEGYGDRYIVPSRGLLDDLADEFGYAEAGVKLKKARAHTREMIKNQTAAACDYVEVNRRQTAINFVVDAFDGKVDSALARIKDDNAGTIEQTIRDAYSLVNYNGQAFRVARITEGFLAARLDELRWAATAQQLRTQQREEQQRIREKMREEEKARREYEQAMKDAAHEQQLIQKAMEAARQQVENANESERAEYEQKLADLKQKLLESEEKGKKAISMAQQTKKGHVYIISNIGSFGEGVYKIGQTRRLEPQDRVDELGGSSVPFDFDVHAFIPTDDAPALERQLHKQFVLSQINKVNIRKEFFRISIDGLKEQIEKLGFEVNWTLASVGAQYRESVAIDQRLQEDTIFKTGWIQRQVRTDPTSDAPRVPDKAIDSAAPPEATNLTVEIPGLTLPRAFA